MIAVVLSKKVPNGEKHWNPLGAKQKSALELYDDLREKAGFDAWDIVYHSKDDGPSKFFGCGVYLTRGLDLLGPLTGAANQSTLIQVHSRKATHVNVRIPRVNLSPPSNTSKEEHEDWKTSLDEFQEWLGLVCIGSQR